MLLWIVVLGWEPSGMSCRCNSFDAQTQPLPKDWDNGLRWEPKAGFSWISVPLQWSRLRAAAVRHWLDIPRANQLSESFYRRSDRHLKPGPWDLKYTYVRIFSKSSILRTAATAEFQIPDPALKTSYEWQIPNVVVWLSGSEWFWRCDLQITLGVWLR